MIVAAQLVLLFLLSLAWVYVLESVEDYLPLNELVAGVFIAVCFCNPFAWLFIITMGDLR